MPGDLIWAFLTTNDMAKKTGVINSIDKHDELTRSEMLIIEKQSQIKKYRKKKKTFTMSTSKGIIQTTDPKKWEAYNNNRVYV